MHSSRSYGFVALALLAAGSGCRQRPAGAALRSEEVAKPFGFADLRSILAEQAPKTIDELIPLLPADFRSRPILLSDSRSTQEGAPLTPRVILATPDLSFALAFNGDVGLNGYDDIETSAFDRTQGTYIFREIAFPASGETGPVQISVDNPKSCTTCHRSPPRASWEQWPSWPEAYFGKDHTVDGSAVPADELANFQAFLAGPAPKGRYRSLLGLERYAQAEAIRGGDPAKSYNGLVLDQIEIMVTQEILRHPAYERMKWLFAAAVSGCEDMGSFVRPSERAKFPTSPESIAKDTRLKNAKAGPRVIALRYLFENFKLPTVHWSPSLRTKWAFRRGPGSPDDLDLTRVFGERSGLGPLPDCAAIKAKALSETPAAVLAPAAAHIVAPEHRNDRAPAN